MLRNEKEIIRQALVFDYNLLTDEEIRLEKELVLIRSKKKSVSKQLRHLNRSYFKILKHISQNLRFMDTKNLSRSLQCPEK